jgi:hypothetical protein
MNRDGWCVRTEQHDALLGLVLALKSALHLTEQLLRRDFAQVHDGRHVGYVSGRERWCRGGIEFNRIS